MVVRKITHGKNKGKFGVYHCHGKKKGTLIKSFRTKKKARAMHTAIIMSELRRKKSKR